MNTENNRRNQLTQKLIGEEFLRQLETKELNKITVSGICNAIDINRGTFYRYYMDVYDLADKIYETLQAQVETLYPLSFTDSLYGNESFFLKLFRHIKENQTTYKICMKIHYNDIIVRPEKYETDFAKRLYPEDHIDYHVTFFKSGFSALVREWLNNDCKESPEEMAQILREEYNGKIF